MGAITDLWKSERGLVAIAGLILVTVMFALSNITSEQWEALFKWIFVGYTGSKTATGVVETWTNAKIKAAPETQVTVVPDAKVAVVTPGSSS